MNVTKNDILSALGLESENTWIGGALAGFGIGCLVGAGLMALFAPRTGREIRSNLAERFRRGRGEESYGTEAIPSSPPPNY